jgi:hypothetical protein
MFGPRSFVRRPVVWVPLICVIYVVGVALRLDYTLIFHPPTKFVVSDMDMYVRMSRELRRAGVNSPWQVTHPLGFPFLLAWAQGPRLSLERATFLQLGASLLVPPAAGLLGASAFGRRTGLAAAAFASLYSPFIECGALFLSEIHFIFLSALTFTGFLAATRATGWRAVVFAFLGGVALSLSLAMKAVVLPAVMCFAAVYGIGLCLAPAQPRRATWRVPAMVLAAVLGALPLVVQLARVCTRANAGGFCVAGNKSGADLLLGHFGRFALIQWDNPSYTVQFGSPGAYLRHYDGIVHVPFAIYDASANVAAAWGWTKAHPFEAFVLTFDHVYDAFFGAVMWPSDEGNGWMWGHLAQPIFLCCLLLPTLFALSRLSRRGLRAVLSSRTLLVLSPVIGLVATLMIATGEVRYRIPFDLFFIVVACSLLTGDFQRVDAPDSARRSPPRAWRALARRGGARAAQNARKGITGRREGGKEV